MNILHSKYIKKNLKRIIYIPGSKSITNRILFLSYICNNSIIKLINPLISEDTKTLINIFKSTKGRKIYLKKNIIKITNKYKKNVYNFKKNILNLNNAGTVARPIISLFLTSKIKQNIILKGNSQMQKRPIKQLINIITSNCEKTIYKYIKRKNFLPIKIYKHKKINILTKIILIKEPKSSQIITSLLMCLPNIIKNKLTLKIKNIPSKLYINLTLNVMKFFNIKIKRKKNNLILNKGKIISPKIINIETDCTPISYFIINHNLNNNKIIIPNIKKNSKQNEIKILKITKLNNSIFKFKKQKFLTIQKLKKPNEKLKKKILNIDVLNIPDSAMIIPMLIINKIQIIKIFNTKTWNYKESNRTKSLTKELKKFKYIVKKGKNWIIYLKNNKKINKNILIKTYNDHRIAMMMYSFKKLKNINIINPNCVKKTLPNFFNIV